MHVTLDTINGVVIVGHIIFLVTPILMNVYYRGRIWHIMKG